MKEVSTSPDDETMEEYDMLELQEPPHMNISHKRNQAQVHEIIQEAERYGALEVSIRKRKKLNPFPSYVELMCDLVDKETTSFKVTVWKKEWVEVMTKEYQSIMRNNVWDIVPKLEGKSVV